MASAGSKGNTKRHSALQKAHYGAYRLIDKRRTNKIKKLKMIARKAKRKPPRVVKVDRGAIAALKLLTN